MAFNARTWSSGELVTATSMNTLRDALRFLKGLDGAIALDNTVTSAGGRFTGESAPAAGSGSGTEIGFSPTYNLGFLQVVTRPSFSYVAPLALFANGVWIGKLSGGLTGAGDLDIAGRFSADNGLASFGGAGVLFTGAATGQALVWSSANNRWQPGTVSGGGGGSGTVTSVALSLPNIFSVSGSPVTSSGTLTAALASQAAATVLAAPTGASGTPTFRALALTDLPQSGATDGQSLVWSAANSRWQPGTVSGGGGGSGTVTSVALSLPNIFSVTGSPVTTSGTLTAALATQSAKTFFAGPTSGAASAPTFRAFALTDIPQASATDGQALVWSAANSQWQPGTVSGGSGSGTVTSVALALPTIFSVSGSPITSSGTLTAALASQAAATVLAAPTGAAGVPTFRALALTDLPTGVALTGSTNSFSVAQSFTGGAWMNLGAYVTFQPNSGGGADLRSTKSIRMGDISGTNTFAGGAFQLFSDSVSTFGGQLYFDAGSATNAAIIFRTNNSDERARITKTGTFYLGKTSGLTGAGDLDIAGKFSTDNASPSFGGAATLFTGATDGQALVWSATNSRWQPGTVSGGGGGSGTVTSVALSLPNIFSVTGSPVTSSGTLTAALASQAAATVLAAPTGTAGVPTFRTLAATDIPALDTAKITSGAFGLARGGTGADLSAASAGFVKAPGAGGAFTTGAIAASDLPNHSTSLLTSGTLALARGGTGADLSATGGTSQVVKQSSAGGVLTVGALTASEIPNLDTAKLTTGVLPVARGGTGVSATPTFFAHKNGTTQSGVAYATQTLVTFGTESFDTNNNFASNRFTPTVAGKYLLSFAVGVQGIADGTALYGYVFKNGTSIAEFSVFPGGTNDTGVSGNMIADANGSTDYFEIYVAHTTSTARTIRGESSVTFFTGGRIG